LKNHVQNFNPAFASSLINKMTVFISFFQQFFQHFTDQKK